MIIKVSKGNEYAYIDNMGEIQGKVGVVGNSGLADTLHLILNLRTGIRFKGELENIPDELIIKERNKPPQIFKASNRYLKEYFIKHLELQGFKVTIVQEESK